MCPGLAVHQRRAAVEAKTRAEAVKKVAEEAAAGEAKAEADAKAAASEKKCAGFRPHLELERSSSQCSLFHEMRRVLMPTHVSAIAGPLRTEPKLRRQPRRLPRTSAQL